MGRPSIDPELMIRMLVAEYVFAIRSERLICSEMQVNLGSAISVSRTLSLIIRRSRAPATRASVMEMFSAACWNGLLRHALPPVWPMARGLQSMQA
jgi:hypothetical protein